MMNDKMIKKAFENVTPSEELVNKVLAFNKDTAPVTVVHKKAHIKRIVCTAAAACAVVICSLTVAAATGVIDFKAVFGDYIKISDDELANSLAGTVSGFRYKVSDEDYGIRMKGVTGTENSIIAIAELYRIDGEPVKEHFANPTEEKYLKNLWEHYKISSRNGGSGGSGGSYGSYVNEDGNIELYLDWNCSSSLNGERITWQGENFYPQFAYWDFLEENEIGYMRWRDFSGYVASVNGSISSENYFPKDVDDSGIIALRLEWEFSFEYEASENSLATKDCTAPTEKFTYYQDIYEFIPLEGGSYTTDEDSYILYENTVKVNSISIGAVGGKMELSYDINEYEDAYIDPFKYSVRGSTQNEFFLIMADGTTLPVRVGGTSSSTLNCRYNSTWELSYGDDAIREIADIQNVTAISLNGTVYELH
ncbi:MAG: hypothetical protein K2N72_02460 [Oscillospiraceae bacterium]|nr:hypothetical protein [Oscillospiraceae bacterium]